jgi:GT2 family glycosyltransferase
MADVRFSVIIPVFNKWELTRDCLRSLREHTDGNDFEVIVVDNGSGDATATELHSLGEALFGSRFTGLRNGENKNFAPACNQGAVVATAPLVFFLNNDTLLTENWAPPLERAFQEDGKLGAAGPLLLYKDDHVQHLGVTFAASTLFHLYEHFPKDHPAVRKPRRLQALTAAALMMPRALFQSIGGFYEGYINGFEDVDLSLRIRRNGLHLRCVPRSRVYHLAGQTPGRSDHEAHNGGLLQERCGKDSYVDYHHHAVSDGFAVHLDERCRLVALLADEEDQALRHEAGDNPQKLLRLALANPFWLWGHERLAELLTREKKYVEALHFLANAADICPTPERYKNVLRAAVAAGDVEMRDKSADRLKKMLADLQDTDRMARTLKKLMAKAERFNDRMLLGMCLDRRREMSLSPHVLSGQKPGVC